jgi:hypothetical protein
VSFVLEAGFQETAGCLSRQRVKRWCTTDSYDGLSGEKQDGVVDMLLEDERVIAAKGSDMAPRDAGAIPVVRNNSRGTRATPEQTDE